MLFGTVTRYDEPVGLGSVLDDEGREYRFHCIEIADGTRTIDVGQAVAFVGLPRLGLFQAGQIHKR